MPNTHDALVAASQLKLSRTFHSNVTTFNEAEHNYDIHDRELLAVFRALTHWRHLLLSSPHKVTVLTDHKNLEYYKEPHHIN